MAKDSYDTGTADMFHPDAGLLAYLHVVRLRETIPEARRVPLTDLIRQHLVICPPREEPVPKACTSPPITLTAAMKEVLHVAGLD